MKVRRRQLMEVQNMEEDDQDNYEEVKITRSNAGGRVKMTEHQENVFVKSQERSFYMKNEKSFVSGQMNSESLSHNE